ncbi:MAG: hypothetical protein QME40_03615 [bacterium]|nr:hypothetical protein [bacterium]
MNKVLTTFLLSSLIIIGCRRLPGFEGKVYENQRFGFSIKIYLGYKKIREQEDRAVLFERDGDKVCIVFWRGATEDHKWFRKVFSNPTTRKNELQQFCRNEEVVEAKKMDIGNCDAFCYKTRGRGYRSLRLEIFPYKKTIRISLLFRYKNSEHKILNMIDTIRID